MYSGNAHSIASSQFLPRLQVLARLNISRQNHLAELFSDTVYQRASLEMDTHQSLRGCPDRSLKYQIF
jgi:hypothetical protein